METMGQAQEDFIQNIADKLGRPVVTSTPDRPESGPPGFWQEVKLDTETILSYFETNLSNLGGQIAVVDSEKDMIKKLIEWLEENKSSKIIRWDHPQLNQIFSKLKTSSPLEVTFWEPNSDSDLIKNAADAQVGVTWVDYAVAFTGSLVLFSTPLQGRCVSLLPPVHIALMNRSQIVAKMSDVFKDLKSRQVPDTMPPTVNIITGASRTADIEMDLIIGVHGPKKIYALILND